ncbi:hypothetical protein R4B61_07525 (plasmid) [Fructilactobacillus vespulae]|uniref:hypothetical protein n=1 Tax=Fructilactobacillus vespulae TaxID=1249630 RepID=UPI0039B3B148
MEEKENINQEVRNFITENKLNVKAREFNDFYNVQNTKYKDKNGVKKLGFISDFSKLADHCGEKGNYKILMHNTSMFIHPEFVNYIYEVSDGKLINKEIYNDAPDPKEIGFHFIIESLNKVIEFCNEKSYIPHSSRAKFSKLENTMIQEMNTRYSK